MTFWKNKRVLVTGHTGFKGAWLSELLLARGAIVSGVALPPEERNSLFEQLALSDRMGSAILDIRDAAALARSVEAFEPEIVLHLAAQSLVRRSYQDPVANWATNVMGTVHLLDATRRLNAPVTVVVVTTDKVYENFEWAYAYRENDPLGGYDPYSASKAATELVSTSWRRSFGGDGLKIATARAGNVIGGGDWAQDRLLPDIIRALQVGKPVEIRNPAAIRPWQHVLDPLFGYLQLAEKAYGAAGEAYQSSYNFGPEPMDVVTVRELAETILQHWPGKWIDASDANAVHESGRLALSIDKARHELGWTPVWRFNEAIVRTVEWYRLVDGGKDAADITRDQIAAFEAAR